MIERVTSQYEHALQAVYWHIANRGIRVDTNELRRGRHIVDAEIVRNLAIASTQWGIKVYIGAENAPEERDGSVNLNASQGKSSFLNKLKDLGYEVPKITKKNEEGDYEQKFSAGELALQKMLATNQFNYPGGDPAIRAVLKIRELGKLRSAYFNARLLQRGEDYFFLSNYNVAGTLSGRRSSRKHTFGFGNNGQNFPKHSEVAPYFRKALTARPGNVLLMVDQVQAEDWPVSALAYNLRALEELRNGLDRHTHLASAIFGIPISSRTTQEWKDSIERYLGKKTRHASNYDMGPGRMSDALAQEGHSIGTAQCKVLLDKVAALDPSVKGVFHKYVQDCISSSRLLVTPFGRERQILGARPEDNNSSVFKEAYSFIPQSTVGDNTGFTVLLLETEIPPEERAVIQEGHDSVVQDIPSTVEGIYKCLLRTALYFKRTIRFHNGIEIEIPIEAELGYNFHITVKIKDFTRAGVKEALEKLDEKTKKGTLSSGASIENLVA